MMINCLTSYRQKETAEVKSQTWKVYDPFQGDSKYSEGSAVADFSHLPDLVSRAVADVSHIYLPPSYLTQQSQLN